MATSGDRSSRNIATADHGIQPGRTTSFHLQDLHSSASPELNPRTLTQEPDSDAPNGPNSAEPRPELRPWRRYSHNPFEPSFEENGTTLRPTPGGEEAGNGMDTPGTPGVGGRRRFVGADRMASTFSGKTVYSVVSQVSERKDSEHPPLKNPGSEWVYLFYDLAWSASFASLTETGDFQKPLDTVNYFLFFAAVLWLWSSQTLYSIHFYTNDWFHLLSTFFQLFIFGMLSATTLGYDVTTYIAHSPGINTLRKSGGNDDSDPQQYADNQKAYLSMLVLAIAFAITRLIHLIQYLRVLYYAHWSTRQERSKPAKAGTKSETATPLPPRPWMQQIPPQLKAITIGLLISNPMFIAALGITASDLGSSVLGASLKLGLWILGFIVEVFSHLIMPFWWWVEKIRRQRAAVAAKRRDSSAQEASGVPQSELTYGETVIPPERKLPVPSDMHLYKRTQTITTIILGEGINGIAGTLSTVLIAPGVGRTVGINVVSTACIIWFIAYIYFEGPKGETSPQITSLRYMIWLVLHLPFLASTVLLLIGIKSQFLLTSFLSALFRSIEGFDRIIQEELVGHSNATYWRTNPRMKHFLLQRGIVWADEFNNLLNQTANSTAADKPMVMPVWTLRLSLKMVINTFESINGEDGIPSDVQDRISAYNENFTQVAQDYLNKNNPQEAEYYQILTEILHGFILSTRYIIAFAGLILISLALQDFIHSPDRNWYQWRVIVTRFLMGVVLCLLLLLNLGKYQVLFVPVEDRDQRAGVFLWLETFWVLPTMAIAYGLQFLIEVFLGWRDKVTKERAEKEKAKKEAEKQKPATGDRPTMECPRQSLFPEANQEKTP